MASRPGKKTRRTAASGRARVATRSARAKGAELDLRRTPMQARGQATFEKILDATARLLDKVGTEGLTTNLIARTAEVNVATLYQYFPNKQAVLLELFKRQNDKRVEIGERLIPGMSQTTDWRRNVQNALQAVANAQRGLPGAAALRLAMRSSPDLMQYDREQSARIASNLAGELVQAGLRQEKAQLVARCAIEALSAVLDFWSLESNNKDDRIVEQCKDLLCAYLAPYFDNSKAVARAVRRRA